MKSEIFKKIAERDKEAITKVQRIQTKIGIFLFSMVTYSGSSPTWFLVAIGLFILGFLKIELLENQELFLFSMRPALGAWILGLFIKRLVKRNRPIEAIQKFKSQRFLLRKDDSFPSSHTAAATAFFTTLLIYQHPYAPIFGIWCSMIAFSRLYLTVHFPSDIFAGAILGILTSFLVTNLLF